MTKGTWAFRFPETIFYFVRALKRMLLILFYYMFLTLTFSVLVRKCSWIYKKQKQKLSQPFSRIWLTYLPKFFQSIFEISNRMYRLSISVYFIEYSWTRKFLNREKLQGSWEENFCIQLCCYDFWNFFRHTFLYFLPSCRPFSPGKNL